MGRLHPTIIASVLGVFFAVPTVHSAPLLIQSSDRRLITTAIGVLPAVSIDSDQSVTLGPFDSEVVATIQSPIRNNFGVPIGTSGGRASGKLQSDVSANGIQLEFEGSAKPPQSSFATVKSDASFQSLNLITFGVLESTLVRLDLEAEIDGSGNGVFLLNDDTDSQALFTEAIDINNDSLNYSNQIFTLIPGKTYSLSVELKGALKKDGALPSEQMTGSYVVSLISVPELSSTTLLWSVFVVAAVIHRSCRFRELRTQFKRS